MSWFSRFLLIMWLAIAAPAFAQNAPSGNTNGVANWSSAKLQNLQACVAGVTTNGTKNPCVMAFVGDSTTAGYCADGNCVNNRLHSWPYQLAAKMTAAGIPTTTDSFWGCSNGTTPTTCNSAFDSRISAGANWSTQVVSFGGNSLFFPANTTPTPLTFMGSQAFNQADFYFIAGFNPLATVVITKNAVAPTTAVASTSSTGAGCTVSLGTVTLPTGVSGICKVTMTWAADSITTTEINATSSADGRFYVYGIAERDTANPKVEIYNGGIGGSSSYSWTQGSGFPFFGPVQELAVIAPKVTFLGLGINDWGGIGTLNAPQPTTIQNYQIGMNQIVSTAAATGDVINFFETQSDPVQSGASVASQQAYDASMQQLRLPHLDFQARWISFANASALGYMGGSSLNNEFHPNATGYADQASYVMAVISDLIH